mmetsp:Transcript_48471/g.115286  ORF Transcript_48471/g.115286 Transcript_48471/m.115286 type:complete len:220 (+) Transcript_48471:2214-2873(+)
MLKLSRMNSENFSLPSLPSTFPPRDQTRANMNCFFITSRMSGASRFAPFSAVNRLWNKRQSERMRLFCIDGIASCVFRTAQWCVFGTHSSKSASRASLSSSLMPAGEYLLTHVTTGGRHPRASGGFHTTPRRETVAGEATAQSSTSKSMRMVFPLSLMRSPFGRHSVRLSSSTVFMFSIQMASMGPSKTTNFLSSVWSEFAFLMIVDPRPSVHSLVMRL